MTRQRKKRICLRLPAQYVLELRCLPTPMSRAVDECLCDLVHALQCGRLTMAERATLQCQMPHTNDTISCNYRLNASAIEYLQFNGFCVSTCIKYALNKMLHT